jgi:hypothetical protein
MQSVVERDPNLPKVGKDMLGHVINRYNVRTGFYDVDGKGWEQCFFPSNDYFQHWLGISEKHAERGREAMVESGWLITDADGRLDLNWARAASILEVIEGTWKERKKLMKRGRLMREDEERFKKVINAAYEEHFKEEQTEVEEPLPAVEVTIDARLDVLAARSAEEQEAEELFGVMAEGNGAINKYLEEARRRAETPEIAEDPVPVPVPEAARERRIFANDADHALWAKQLQVH